MDKELSHERILIAVALILCAVLIGYNAFFVPQAATPAVVYVQTGSSSVSSDEAYTPLPPSGSSKQPMGRINLNTATAQNLADALPGVGPTLAQRIVDYRTTSSGFKSVEELKNVDGIGDKTYDAIKDLVYIQ